MGGRRDDWLTAMLVQTIASILNSNPPTVSECLPKWGLTEEEARAEQDKQVGGFLKQQTGIRKG